MKKFKQSLFSFLFLIPQTYFLLALFIFTPLFNWRYANENGFIKWLFFGEVVATAKAFVFPYYLFTSPSGDINVLDLNSQQFYLSLEISQKATKIINQNSDIIVPEENVKSIILYEKQALEVGNKVDIGELEKRYSGLGYNFENKFLKGLRLYIEGMNDIDSEMAIEGQNLKSEWDSWYIDHITQIKTKLKTN